MPTITYKEPKERTVDIWGKTLKTRFVFMEQIARKMKNGYSPIVAICGGQRTGKSFIGLWIAYIIYQLNGREFNPTEITFYDPEKAIKRLKDKEKDVVMIDEAGDVMDYQEWAKKTHRALRSMINTQAYKNNLYIFISPFIAQVDRSLRIHCDFIVHVKSRGRFLVWKYGKRYDADDIKDTTSRIFMDNGGIRMKDIPRPLWKKYLDHSIEEKEKIREARILAEKTTKPVTDIEKLVEISQRVRGG